MPSAHTWVTIGSGDPPPIPLAPVRVLDPLFSGAPPSAYDFNIENPSENKRTYSSYYSATTIESMLDSGVSTKSWRSKTATANQWVQIDLGAVKSVLGVVTQGHLQSNYWVKSYTVSTSTAGDTWLPVNNAGHFNGNTDKGSRVRNNFALVAARYVRIYAQTWQTIIVMRAGVVVTTGTPPWIPYRSYSILALAADYSCSTAPTSRMSTLLYFLLL